MARGATTGLALALLVACGCAGQAPATPADGEGPGEPVSASEGRSLAELEGVEWVLTRLAADEPAPATPEITLVVEQGRFAGASGCNRYSAFGLAGEQPGELSLGPTLGTRMACAAELMALEQSYLSKLQGVGRWRIEDGVLRLDWSTGEGEGTMSFSSRPPPE